MFFKLRDVGIVFKIMFWIYWYVLVGIWYEVVIYIGDIKVEGKRNIK